MHGNVRKKRFRRKIKPKYIYYCNSMIFLPYGVVQPGFRAVLLLGMNLVSCRNSETVLISHWSVHHFEFPFETCLLMAEFLHRYFDAGFGREDLVFLA